MFIVIKWDLAAAVGSRWLFLENAPPVIRTPLLSAPVANMHIPIISQVNSVMNVCWNGCFNPVDKEVWPNNQRLQMATTPDFWQYHWSPSVSQWQAKGCAGTPLFEFYWHYFCLVILISHIVYHTFISRISAGNFKYQFRQHNYVDQMLTKTFSLKRK